MRFCFAYEDFLEENANPNGLCAKCMNQNKHRYAYKRCKFCGLIGERLCEGCKMKGRRLIPKGLLNPVVRN